MCNWKSGQRGGLITYVSASVILWSYIDFDINKEMTVASLLLLRFSIPCLVLCFSHFCFLKCDGFFIVSFVRVGWPLVSLQPIDVEVVNNTYTSTRRAPNAMTMPSVCVCESTTMFLFLLLLTWSHCSCSYWCCRLSCS